MTTREEAIQFYRNEIKFLHAAPKINGCEMKDYWQKQIEIHTMALEALQGEVVTERNQQGDCKWMQDEFCVNHDCPMRADYCPVPDNPGVCRFEDRRGEDG